MYVPYGDGQVQTGYMTVGGGFGDGELTVDGIGSTLEIDCMLEVGRDGAGTVWVQNGGSLDIIGAPPDGGYSFIGMRAPGDVSVSGPESSFSLAGQLSVGQAHAGTLTISDGGTVLAEGTFIVGDLAEPAATGTVLVIGSDSTLHTGLTRISNAAPAYLLVTDGARLETARQVQLGYIGEGTLEITSGGQVVSHKSTSPTATSGILAWQPGSRGRAWIDGAGSQWTHDGALNVGWGSTGELEITSGGFVESFDGVLGRLGGSSGLVTVTDPNSTWNVIGTLSIGGLPDAAGGDATLSIADGARVTVTDNLLVWPAGTAELAGGTIALGASPMTLQGRLGGCGVISGSVAGSGGTTAPGVPLGTLEVRGDYVHDAASTLAVQIGGREPPLEYDQLAVTGSALLSGTLRVELAGGFVPEIGDRFAIVTAQGSVLATFGTQELPSMPGLRFVVTGSTSAVTVAVTWPADVDGDLDVDFDDFLAFSACMLGPDAGLGPDCGGFDANSDEDVDLADFQAFQRIFTGAR